LNKGRVNHERFTWPIIVVWKIGLFVGEEHHKRCGDLLMKNTNKGAGTPTGQGTPRRAGLLVKNTNKGKEPIIVVWKIGLFVGEEHHKRSGGLLVKNTNKGEEHQRGREHQDGRGCW